MRDTSPKSSAKPGLPKHRQRVAILLDELGRGLYEREEAVRLCLLAALAGESVFLLGPPGVAKSLIARRLKEIFPPAARSFEYLMNRFSTPDEIFGPVSIKSLKRDRLKRKTEFYLPKATVVFLDEIWKAGPSIQNTLLTVINERKFRNGDEEQDVDLRVLVSASNELPEENQGLEALWDRFLIRLLVKNIVHPDNRRRLLRDGSTLERISIDEEVRFTPDELREMDQAIDKVEIPDQAFDVIEALIAHINDHNENLATEDPGDLALDEHSGDKEPKPIYISDRRWKKIGRLLRASALLNDRGAVNMEDCFLIRHCIWNEEEQIEDVGELVRRAIEDSLGPQYLAEKEQAWSSLKANLASLPTATVHLPKAYKFFYMISLRGEGKDRLKDAAGRIFGRLDKADYGALSRQGYRDVRLHESGADEDQAAVAVVQGQRGRGPLEVILRSAGDGPLAKFSDTIFELQKGKASTVIDRDSEAVQAFLEDTRIFAGEIEETMDFVAALRRDFSRSDEMHLFVSLPPDQLDNLRDVTQETCRKLVQLAAEVRDFCRQWGLESCH